MTQNEAQATGNLKLLGGWLCLDFANTAEWHDSDSPVEHLNSYPDLVAWSQQAGVLAKAEAQQCLKQAQLRQTEANAVFKRAIILRETLHRIFSAIARHKPSNNADTTILNAELSEAMVHMRLTPSPSGHSWVTTFEGEALDRMLWQLVRSAADLLTSPKLSRVRKCSSKDCGWLFLDMSRNRSRKWCSMEDCGNRAKARRHYQRKRKAIA